MGALFNQKKLMKMDAAEADAYLTGRVFLRGRTWTAVAAAARVVAAVVVDGAAAVRPIFAAPCAPR